MLPVIIIGILSAFITTGFIIAEIHWSLQNLNRLLANYRGIWKVAAVPFIPICFLPVLWDVLITIGLSFLFGFSGVLGMMVSMVASSVIAAYLFFQRRRNGWRYA